MAIGVGDAGRRSFKVGEGFFGNGRDHFGSKATGFPVWIGDDKASGFTDRFFDGFFVKRLYTADVD